MQSKCGYLIYGATVAVAIAGLLSGCFGEKIGLPPVTVTMPVVQGIQFGPSSGLTPGRTLNGYTLVDGLTCNLPTEDDVMAEVRRQAGGTIAGMISLERVEVNRVTLTASAGDFSSLTGLFLGFVTVGLGGVTPVPLGIAANPQGFGATVNVLPLGSVDLLPILKQPAPTCGAAVVTVVGEAPQTDTTLDVSMQVTVFLGLGLF